MAGKAKARRTAGAKSKLTPEVQQRICAVIADGGGFAEAAKAGGIGVSTLSLWLRRGEDGDGDAHVAFLEAVTRAREATTPALRLRLTNEQDWRAWEAAVRHDDRRAVLVANKRKLDAEADILEAKAIAAKAAAKEGGGAAMVLLAEDVLHRLSDDDRRTFLAILTAANMVPMVRRDLARDEHGERPTAAEMARFTPAGRSDPEPMP